MAGVYALNDGTTSWVSASGATGGFLTAGSSPSSINIMFVEGLSWTTAQQTYFPILDRGIVKQTKFGSQALPTLDIPYMYTGGTFPDYPIHIQFGMEDTTANTSAYLFFTHCLRTNMSMQERQEGNMITESFVFNTVSAGPSALID